MPGGSAIKNPPASAEDVGLIPGSGRSAGGGNGNPPQHSYLGNPTDRGAWQPAVHAVAKAVHNLATKQRQSFTDITRYGIFSIL